MRIPAVDSYLEYTAGVGGTSVNTFVHPDLTPAGMPYSPSLSELVVAVDDIVTTAYVNNGNGTITLNSDAAVGSTVKIWRVTPVLESLVTFPVPTKMDPKFNNKSITQLLLCIQEVWGGLKELDGGITTRLQTLSDSVNAAMEALRAYVNNAIASVFEISGVSGATWSSTVAAGDTYLDTPYVFNQGILMVGGSMYNLSNPDHATLSIVGNHTRITFTNPILADHEVILMVFSSTEATTFDYSGLNASTYSASWSAEDTTLLVPFVFTRGILILGGVTYDFSSPGHGITLTDIGGVSTLITLDTAPLTDHEAIVIMFSEPS
jgi:hypothetical protein